MSKGIFSKWTLLLCLFFVPLFGQAQVTDVTITGAAPTAEATVFFIKPQSTGAHMVASPTIELTTATAVTAQLVAITPSSVTEGLFSELDVVIPQFGAAGSITTATGTEYYSELNTWIAPSGSTVSAFKEFGIYRANNIKGLDALQFLIHFVSDTTTSLRRRYYLIVRVRTD